MKSFSQEATMSVDEVSAFQQPDEEDEDKETQVQVDELHRLRAEMLEEREKMSAKYEPLNFDQAAIKFFFKSLKQSSGDDESFWQ